MGSVLIFSLTSLVAVDVELVDYSLRYMAVWNTSVMRLILFMNGCYLHDFVPECVMEIFTFKFTSFWFINFYMFSDS